MFDQPKYEPLEASPFFADGAAARPLPAHTVARGHLRAEPWRWTGIGADGRPLADFPVAVDEALLRRGRKVYDVFCSPCHDRTGGGDGMVVRRGFKRPPSFHDERLRQAPPGHFVAVVAEGFGQMPAYAAQVPPADRWAVAAYLRALQLARRFPAAELSAEERARLDAPPAPAGAAAAGGTAHGH
jgi:mono/diheme cytochrome c family protein